MQPPLLSNRGRACPPYCSSLLPLSVFFRSPCARRRRLSVDSCRAARPPHHSPPRLAVRVVTPLRRHQEALPRLPVFLHPTVLRLSKPAVAPARAHRSRPPRAVPPSVLEACMHIFFSLLAIDSGPAFSLLPALLLSQHRFPHDGIFSCLSLSISTCHTLVLSPFSHSVHGRIAPWRRFPPRLCFHLRPPTSTRSLVLPLSRVPPMSVLPTRPPPPPSLSFCLSLLLCPFPRLRDLPSASARYLCCARLCALADGLFPSSQHVPASAPPRGAPSTVPAQPPTRCRLRERGLVSIPPELHGCSDVVSHLWRQSLPLPVSSPSRIASAARFLSPSLLLTRLHLLTPPESPRLQRHVAPVVPLSNSLRSDPTLRFRPALSPGGGTAAHALLLPPIFFPRFAFPPRPEFGAFAPFSSLLFVPANRKCTVRASNRNADLGCACNGTGLVNACRNATANLGSGEGKEGKLRRRFFQVTKRCRGDR